MAEMLFYTKPQLLSRDKHAKLRFKPRTDYSFAKEVTAVPLMAIEFPRACHNYPIVFAQDPSGNLMPLAVLSLQKGGNAFLDDKSQWTSTYVPAFVRRYPFVAASVPNKPNEFGIAFDEASTCFNDTDGESLFDDKGQPTKFLNGQIEFLKRFHQESQRTQAVLKVLKDEGLLMPFNINIQRGVDQQKFAVRDALVVDEAKLQKLAADKAGQLLSSGVMAACFAHLISLANFANLANRAGGQQAGEIPWWAK